MVITPTEQDLSSTKDVGMFQGFRGDYDWIIDGRPDSAQVNLSLSVDDLVRGGICVRPGIDLGHIDHTIFSNILEPILTRSQRKSLRSAVGLRGSDAIELLNTNLASFSALSQLNSETHRKALTIALDMYWVQLVEWFPWLTDSGVSNHFHTILLSWVFDHGFNSSNDMRKIASRIKSGQHLDLANQLYSFSQQEPTSQRTNRRIRESALLLNEFFLLSDSVGPGCANLTADINKVSERLAGLNFFDMSGNLVDDFSPITTFQIITASKANPDGKIIPGDSTHAWMCSFTAPKLAEVPSQMPGIISITPPTDLNSNGRATNWLTDAMSDIGKNFMKIATLMNQENNSIQTNRFSICETGFYDLFFKIEISKFNANDNANTSHPNYDRNTMRVILEAVISNQSVFNSSQIYLFDEVLAAEGLCVLESEFSSSQDSNQFAYVFLSRPLPSVHITHQPVDQYSDDGNHLQIASEIESSTDTTIPEVAALISEYDGIYGPSWAPMGDEDEYADYYVQAMRNAFPNDFVNPVSGVQEHYIPDPLPAGTPYLLGITNWRLDRPFDEGRNLYGDTILMIWNDGAKVNVKPYRASTRPGKFSKFYSVKGDAHLIPGRYTYKRGIHKDYDALVQAGEVSVWRDINKDGIRDLNSQVEVGWFGINIHAGGAGEFVGNWSAGCQVIWGGRDVNSPFEQFMTDIHSLVLQDEVIHYTLIDGQNMQLPNNEGGGS
jgi:hypothetical protein